MKAILQVAKDLTTIRIEADNPNKEKTGDEIDVTKDKCYEDDDESDEDFDDADEEVGFSDISLKLSRKTTSSDTILPFKITVL